MLQKSFWDSYKCGHYFDSYLNQITNCAVSQFVIFNFNFLESEIETLVNLALFPQNAIGLISISPLKNFFPLLNDNPHNTLSGKN